MKSLLIGLAMLANYTGTDKAEQQNDITALYTEIIEVYELDQEPLVILTEESKSVEVYDNEGNLLLRSENISYDLELLEKEFTALYYTADFIMETNDSKIYMVK